MTEIGVASRERKPVTETVLTPIMDAAQKAPLAPEPFLVRGVQAQMAGNEELAGQAFLAAKLRDGRSVSARYFLAQHYFRTGDAGHALTEIAFLAHGLPGGVTKLAPYVGAYVKDKRNWPQIRSLFRSDPSLADATLASLATDAHNTDLVLSFAREGLMNPHTDWAPRMIQALVSAGDFGRARALWADLSGAKVGPATLIYDPDFRNGTAPPPFNWALTSSTVGLAERRREGGLHVIFYGQDDGVLVSELLVLQPGSYRLSMRVSGDAARAKSLAWSLKCANSGVAIASFVLDPAAASKGWTITVPQNCPAQALELAGSGSDLPQQADVTITGLRLDRSNG